jgi:FKBP-type peptidyl-prolyl cis-trans isomerase
MVLWFYRFAVPAVLALTAFAPCSHAAEPIAPPVAAKPAVTTDKPQGLATPAEELGYAIGYRIGQRIIADHKALGTPLDAAALGRGLADAVREAPPQLGDDGFRRVLSEFEKRMEERDRDLIARMEVAARENLAKGQQFLEANAKRPGVTVLPSGLQYEVIKQGAGPKPTLDSVVTAHYRGTHIDGSEFDGTDPKGEPTAFPLRGVIPGWQEALQKMAVGAKWRVWLPPDIAYGEAGSPPAIEPNEVLIFEIELVSIDAGKR